VPAPLPMAIRERFIAAYLAKEGSLRSLAARFKVGPATTNRWWRRYKETGGIEPGQSGGHNEPLLDEQDLESIHLLLDQDPTMTVEQLGDRFVEEGGLPVSRSTLQRALKKLRFTRKKTPRGRTSGTRLG
jgi:transposase